MTALCLTRNRRQWLPQAIQCFLNQTYPNRELLILADGEDVSDLVPDDDRVRLIHIEEGRKIGEKRNFGVSQARGQIVANWDDDDWSAPTRLADQMNRLEASGKAVTGYHSLRFRNAKDGSEWEYRGHHNYALGTSLCFLKSHWQENPFPCLQVGEDNQFVQVAAQKSQLITAHGGDFIWAAIHGGNTSPKRPVPDDNWFQISDASEVVTPCA